MDALILFGTFITMVLSFALMIRKRYLHHDLLKLIYPEELGKEPLIKDISGFGKFLGIDSMWIFIPIYWNDGNVDLTNPEQLSCHKKLKNNNMLLTSTFLLFLILFMEF